jgi:predicted nucleic acid-binding protein
MATVISDTSPVRALAHLEHLPWLEILFQEIMIPPAVASELLNPPAGIQGR